MNFDCWIFPLISNGLGPLEHLLKETTKATKATFLDIMGKKYSVARRQVFVCLFGIIDITIDFKW